MEKCKIKAIHIDSGIFRHIKILYNPGIFRTVAYPETWYIQKQKHIQNPGIFRTLVYAEPPYIQNAGIFRTLSNLNEAFWENS